MSIHPDLAPLARLVGTWRGTGSGEYPTIEPFAYTEELVLTDIGKPFLEYRQRTRAADGRPLHTETGYLRAPAPGRIELVLAQPMGQTELAEGTVTCGQRDDGPPATAPGAGPDIEIRLRSRVVNSASAKHVESTERIYRLVGDTLITEFAMAAVGLPLTHHLSSELRRVAED